MMLLAGACENLEDGKREALDIISSGRAARKMEELIEAQKGNPAVVEDPYLLRKQNT